MVTAQLTQFLQVTDQRDPQLDMHFSRKGFLCLPMNGWLCILLNVAISFLCGLLFVRDGRGKWQRYQQLDFQEEESQYFGTTLILAIHDLVGNYLNGHPCTLYF